MQSFILSTWDILGKSFSVWGHAFSFRDILFFAVFSSIVGWAIGRAFS